MSKHSCNFCKHLEEDLEATEKNLKESSGFIEELLSGLKHRFPVQYANLEGDEYGDDAFSSHDLFEHVIDPAVNAAQKAEANVAQLISAAPDLFEALKKAIDALERADDSFGVPGLHGIINEADAAIRKAEGEGERLTKMVDWLASHTADICASVYQDSYDLHWWTDCEWKEAALRAVAAGEETYQK